MLKPNNQEKPKVVSNTVGKKPGVKVPGKGGIKPQFTKATQALATNQPFLN